MMMIQQLQHNKSKYFNCRCYSSYLYQCHYDRLNHNHIHYFNQSCVAKIIIILVLCLSCFPPKVSKGTTTTSSSCSVDAYTILPFHDTTIPRTLQLSLTAPSSHVTTATTSSSLFLLRYIYCKYNQITTTTTLNISPMSTYCEQTPAFSENESSHINCHNPTNLTSTTLSDSISLTKQRRVSRFILRIYKNVVNIVKQYNPITFILQKFNYLGRRRPRQLSGITDQKVTTQTNIATSEPIVSNIVTSTTLVARSDLLSIERLHQEWNGKWNIVINDDFIQEYDTYLQNLGQPMVVRSIAKSLIRATTEETTIFSMLDEQRDANGGPALQIRSINARGIWERTLISSDILYIPIRSKSLDIACSVLWSNCNVTVLQQLLANTTAKTNHNPLFSSNTTILTADNERVTAEAYWCVFVIDNNDCTISTTAATTTNHKKLQIYHHSWLRGITKYGGGDFESIRYILTDDCNNNSADSPFYVCHSIFHPSNPKREPASVTWRFCRASSATS